MARYKVSDNAYAATHMWMKYHYGKPQKCENCGTTEKRMYHWSNISGTYQRERDDWLRLCVPCHKSNDIKALGGKIKARPRKVQPSKICAECGDEFYKHYQYSYKQWDEKTFCSRGCSAKATGRKRKGSKQTEATKALKSQRLRERWSTNQDWRKYMTTRMIGNKYAIGVKGK